MGLNTLGYAESHKMEYVHIAINSDSLSFLDIACHLV